MSQQHSPQTFYERFLSFVRVADGDDACWNWTGTVAGGYGQFSAFGRKVPAHRAAFELFVDRVPSLFLVCHKCDNKLCVRPSHLFIGSASDNMRDMVKKGRHPKQTGSYRFKLTPDQVREIRRSTETTTALARRFDVSATTINSVRKGRAWKSVQ